MAERRRRERGERGERPERPRRQLGREAENTIIRASFEEERYQRTQKAMALAKRTLRAMHKTQTEKTEGTPADFIDPEWRRQLLIEIGLGAENLNEILRNYQLIEATIAAEKPREREPDEDSEGSEDIEIPDSVKTIVGRMNHDATRVGSG